MTLLSYPAEFTREQIELFEQIYKNLLDSDLYLANRFKDTITNLDVSEQVSELENEISDLEGKIEDLESDLDLLESENTELRKNVEFLSKKAKDT